MTNFITCDVDKDCLLNTEELKTCLQGEDMKVVTAYIPEGFDLDTLVNEIIFSMDYMKQGGLNFNSYLLFKKIVIGYRQYNVNGILDKETFYSAVKTTFVDKLIDEMDAEIAYRIAINLMFEKIKDYKLDFSHYFEICRLVNSFLSFGVTIGEGYVTKDQILQNYEGDRYPSKLNSITYEKYFSLFQEDRSLNLNTDSTSFDPDTLRFEDHATLEFWANIYSNYTDPSFSIPALNMTGFKKLFLTNKYMPKKYWIYIAYSNFEDYLKMNSTQYNSSNITDYDFLINFQSSFIETSAKYAMEKSKMKNHMRNHMKNNLRKEKVYFKQKKTSVFEKFNYKSHSTSHSLFDLELTDDEAKSAETANRPDIKSLLDSGLQYYFSILDINLGNSLSFEEFILFLKYLRLYDRLNKDNDDKRCIIKTNCVNFINQFNMYPKLSVTEKSRVQSFDSLNCQYVDFLMFFDYMIGPKVFKQFLLDSNKNFVDEIHALIVMKKLNLYAEINQRKVEYTSGTLLTHYDYESILYTGLKNKCNSNTRLFLNSNITDSFGNYTQLLNSTLVDPNNVPNMDKELNSTMSRDNVNLDSSKVNGGGMDLI